MVTSFETIHQNAPIEQAIQKILNGRVRKTGHKTISLIVLDDYGNLAGVITMWDILYNLRPDFLNLCFDADKLPWEGQLKILVKKLNTKKVKQLMSTNVLNASADDHIIVLLDKMIKSKIHRLPVLQANRPIGIIYISDVYNSIFNENDKG